MAALVDDTARWYVDDLDELRACEFQRAPGGDVLWITSDPQGIDAEFVREGQDEADGPRGVPMSSKWRVHGVSDVAGIALDVRRRTDAQPDRAHLFAGRGVDHAEVVRRNLVNFVRSYEIENQAEVAVLEGHCSHPPPSALYTCTSESRSLRRACARVICAAK